MKIYEKRIKVVPWLDPKILAYYFNTLTTPPALLMGTCPVKPYFIPVLHTE